MPRRDQPAQGRPTLEKANDPGRASTVQGAAPYQPKMSRAEVLARIQEASGVPRRLGELRAWLPTAGHRRAAGPKEGSGRGHPARRGDVGFGPVGPGRGRVATVTPVPSAPPALTTAEREVLIDQAILMLEEVYAHLPLKRALHAIDPVQRLRLLRLRHQDLDEREFQSEMIDIFVGLRDLHTNYRLPSAYWSRFAFLPFRVEEYYESEDDRRYLVSWISPVSTDAKLKAGVEITHWNGSPIDLAVARNAAREAGSNPEARRARGLEALTLRWLGASLPPDEDWVTLTYTDGTGTIESRFEWQVLEREDLVKLITGTGGGSGALAAGLGIDMKTELLRRVRKALFDAPALKAEAEMAAQRASPAPAAPPAAVSVLPDVFPRFGPVDTPSGTFGYVRIATFAPPEFDVDGAVREFQRILQTLPPEGLILDVRGNPGGYIAFGERILQMLTPGRITPEPFHFVATALTLRMARGIDWLGPWAAPLATALATGAGYSQGFPLTEPDACNEVGQVYQGPVVLITDAFCYSTTDIFAAGFQDHEIGTIVGCHGNTGAGGANVWDYAEVLQQLEVAPNPFVALPGQAGMRVAVRRSTRVGERSGVPLEDLGVAPDKRYYMTRADLLQHNVDLIARAARILADEDKQQLLLERDGTSPLARVRVTVANVDRVDVLVDGRPVVSQDVTAGATTIALPRPVPAGGRIAAQGFRGGKLVASARLVA
jgi:hypothetical protein